MLDNPQLADTTAFPAPLPVVPHPVGDVDRAVGTAAAAATFNLLLWLVTTLAALAALGWALAGGEIGERTAALARLWPLALIWVGGLVGHGWWAVAGVREVIRAGHLRADRQTAADG